MSVRCQRLAADKIARCHAPAAGALELQQLQRFPAAVVAVGRQKSRRLQQQVVQQGQTLQLKQQEMSRQEIMDLLPKQRQSLLFSATFAEEIKRLSDSLLRDPILIEVARRLTACVRQEDTVSRFGGDEYVVVAESLGHDEASAALQAELIAEKIRHSLCQPYHLTESGVAHYSSPSTGVTLFRGQDAARLSSPAG